jgi:hypothetical protein
MIKIVPGPDGAHWSLICDTSVCADVLAHAGSGATEDGGADWQEAVERLRDAAGTLTVRASADGHFLWALVDDEVTIAESPPVYRDAESCRRSFAAARRAARAAIGNGTPIGEDSCAP